jgi:hypothetical protein
MIIKLPAGLLTYSVVPSLPVFYNSGVKMEQLFKELTATGIVPEFDRIPF